MDEGLELNDVKKTAAELDAEVRALPLQNSPNVRAIRRKYSRMLKIADPEFVIELVRELVHNYGYRGSAYELILFHKEAFRSLGEAELEDLGQGINSWWSVDSFARTLAGPAWRDGSSIEYR